MLCLACGICAEKSGFSRDSRHLAEHLCLRCGHSLRPIGAQQLGCGIVVASAYAHEGAGQRLVHRLKYDAVAGLATLLAKQLVPLVPSDATGLVPVPRVVARRILYGVDHGPALAAALARLTGLPVFGALSAPIWAPAHAGRRRDRRRRPAFRSIAAVPAGAVVVDDVVTTGSTIEHAALALGGAVAGAVTVTSAVQRW